MASLHTHLVALGAALPANLVTNDQLAEKMETSHDWIVSRTGIHQRHIAAEGETTVDLAERAAQQAIERSGWDPKTIQCIIFATETPDLTMPASGVLLGARLGLPGVPAFDLHAACSGFVYGLSVADAFVRSGQYSRILVIGAETFSRVVDWDDRGTCILFGDGAGAALLEGREQPGGILGTRLFADGAHAGILQTTGGVSATGSVGVLQMQGKEVFKHAVSKMIDALDGLLTEHHLTVADIDWLVPHQANRRILDAIGEKMGIPAEKVVVTLDRHANTSAASIPLALHNLQERGEMKSGQLLALQALGAGLTWGACLIRI